MDNDRLYKILEEAADDILLGINVGEIFNDLESNLTTFYREELAAHSKEAAV